MAKTATKRLARMKRKKHIRQTIRGTPERPRLCVFRSKKHIYSQLIDDVTGRTIASASTVDEQLKDVKGGAKEGAIAVGKLIAERAKQRKISTIVFDRNGYLYHGRIAALAGAVREAGIEF